MCDSRHLGAGARRSLVGYPRDAVADRATLPDAALVMRQRVARGHELVHKREALARVPILGMSCRGRNNGTAHGIGRTIVVRATDASR